jgi:hypothetical protein
LENSGSESKYNKKILTGLRGGEDRHDVKKRETGKKKIKSNTRENNGGKIKQVFFSYQVPLNELLELRLA